MPATGEYANYNPTTAYDPQVPVGWIDSTSPTRETAVMITGDGVTVGNGCFKCHSAKDN